MRNRYLFIADLVLIPVCAFGAFALRLDWFLDTHWDAFQFFALTALLTKPPIYYSFGLYWRYWRYASIRDLLVVLLATAASSVVLSTIVTAGFLTELAPRVPRSVLAIDWLLALSLVGGLRMSVRVITESRSAAVRKGVQVGAKSVLVVGAGDAGAMVVREMKKNGQLQMRPVGFLDDDPAKLGKRILDVPVRGPLSVLTQVAASTDADEIVIAMPRAGGSTVRAVVQEARKTGLPFRIIPGMFELLDGQVSVERLRRVEISDLLRRPPVVSAADDFSYLAGATILITGAGGSIGSELCRQVARAGAARLVLVGHGENSIFEIERHMAANFSQVRCRPVIADVRDRDRLTRIVRDVRPDVVLHAAAHKHVPLMEENPTEAITNNVLGTRNIVDATVSAGTLRFVLVSTDKAVAPSSVMGASKRIAEALVRSAGRRFDKAFAVVRFGNVLDSRGSVVPVFKRQIAVGGPITITHPDVARFFMTIPEAVHLVLQAGGMGRSGELFVLNMGQPIRIVQLAEDLLRLSGFSPGEVPIVFTGLRPGEKLTERLWEQGANTYPTQHPEILRVEEPSQIGDGDLDELISGLSSAAAADDDGRICAVLADSLPSYVPSAGVPANPFSGRTPGA